MKKILFISVILSSLFISCSKDGDDDTEEPVSQVYLNTNPGSSWLFESIDNAGVDPTEEYTVTSTNRDTTADGKTYHVYTNSISQNEYNRKSGNEYFAYQALPFDITASNSENLYLKAGASVNSSWSQQYPISYMGVDFTIKLTNRMLEKGLTKTINGQTYTDVVHTKTDVSVSGLPPGTLKITTDIHQYYAPNYGLIESNTKIEIDALGDIQSTDITTRLKSATLL